MADFNLDTYILADSKHGNRTAKPGETLYLVGHGDIKATVTGTAGDFKKAFTHPDLTWSVIHEAQSNPQDLYAGKSTFARGLGSNPVGVEKRKYSVEARDVDGKTLSADVVIVDRNHNKIVLNAGSDNWPDEIKEAFKAKALTDKAYEFLGKIPFIKKCPNKNSCSEPLSFYYDVTPFEREEENIEASDNLYYTKYVISGGFEMGLKGEATIWTWGLPTNKIPIVGQYIKAGVDLKASAKAAGEIKARLEQHKYVNSSSFKKINSGINPARIKLEADFGPEAKFSVLESSTIFSCGATATGKAKAVLVEMGYKDGKFVNGLLKEGVKIEAYASAYAIVLGMKYETGSYKFEKTIIDPL